MKNDRRHGGVLLGARTRYHSSGQHGGSDGIRRVVTTTGPSLPVFSQIYMNLYFTLI